jgi:chitosanase
MNLTAQQKRTIERVVNAFETGSADGDYGKITILRDGPHNIPQITYGRSQTTEYGNLRLLVQHYVAANGIHSGALADYADLVGSVPLTTDLTFRALLREAGTNDPVMQWVQDAFFEKRYFGPALEWADEHGLTLPLSALVVYDSFIHSGGILRVIRSTFPERVPSNGGKERAWITAYVKARQDFLAGHSRPAVRNTVYRTKCLQRQITRDNWQLADLPINAHGVSVYA